MDNQLTFSKFKEEDFTEYKSWYKDNLLNKELGPMDDEWLEHALKERNGQQYSVFQEGKLIAVVGMMFPIEGYPDLYLTDFAIKPDSRYQGIGSEVLKELIRLHPLKSGQSWKAVVNVRNTKAAAFFKKHGWSVSDEPDEHGMLAIQYKKSSQKG
ncbi:MAG: GNAT family N-acetyltransferase [Candidatus Peregrinibacteria bacterium]|nr:GNAT family N-acetyltransferase [Candidatus Peregrinibacteria bacterium]MCB9808601.1 GNAT family N-acetyltransferase [Candidatus Peribacteria bacterium]